MAGDWIKLEHATLDKPEVMDIASSLDIPPDQALGLLVRWFVWVDTHLGDSDGAVTPVLRSTVDAAMRTAGFAAALERARWAAWPREDTLVITNYHHHLSRTAKARALAQRRVQRHRYAANVTQTLPEKRRGSVPLGTDGAGAAGHTAAPGPAREAKPKPNGNGILRTKWWSSDSGIDAAAAKLGLTAHPGETRAALKERIFDVIHARRKTP